ncbi:MAG: TrkH family potassium uptake protein [Thermoleophilia bacterium]|nr:TrkH family potassium uptake protein [Thermoleophilia bacterium]MDH4339218.1 TrkH family potassium uptake protein [Thermoleophilia bacterium]
MSSAPAPTRPDAHPSIAPPRRIGVNIRGALGLVGTLVKWLALAPLLPLALALGYGESPWPFVAAAAGTAALGIALERIGGDRSEVVGFREGFLVVSLTWVLAAAVGTIPYLLSGNPELERPIDAFFESMSGFTTTGSSILTDVEALNRSMAMWRQFTQWIGGMGIIVLALAVLPRLRIGGRQLMESELPGPEIDDLGTRIRQTAQRLWSLYVALTVMLVVILATLGWTGVDDQLSLYEAVAHAFSTMPTGGFSTQPHSIADFAPATQWVLIAFMILAGVNFALLYRTFVRRRVRSALRDEELRLYAGLLVLGSGLLILQLLERELTGSDAAFRNGIFQAVSILTTTGFATVDFTGWTTLALMTIVALMFVGGSAGSTGGSIKVVRHLLLGRVLRRDLRTTVHPELVAPIRLNRIAVDERTLRAAVAFVLLYVGAFVVGAGIIAFDTALQGPDLRPITVMAVAATTLGNVGPAFGHAGPLASFSEFSDISTGAMIALMWLGRLEIIPVVLLFTRQYWKP